MAGIDLAEVSRIYPGERRSAGDVVAVDRLSLSVADGELLALVGPSGSGKTTLLRLIAGLERPSSGEVRIGGRVANELPPLARDVAMVFQSHVVYPHRTVREALSFGVQLRARMTGLSGAWKRISQPAASRSELAEIGRRVVDVARTLGIEELLERRPTELSGGQQQRVALGRALVQRPQVLLLDEPLSHLDGPLRTELRRELKRIHRESRVTTIYVTHDQAEALALGDRVAVLAGGRVQQIDRATTLYRRPANRFAAGFFGSPPMNLLEGGLSEGGPESCVFRSVGWSIAVDKLAPDAVKRCGQRPVVLGIRPEDVSIRAGASDSLADRWNKARVESVESLGDSTLIYLLPNDAGEMEGWKNSLVVKEQGESRWKAGDRVEVRLPTARLHWFDAATGENLSRD
jgi:sn-glycerol 3-phosphate transport system ATP-binding protein